MYEELSHILDKLIRLVFKREAIVEADTTFKVMKKAWLQNSDNHLGDQLVYAGAAKKQKKNDNIQAPTKKRPNSKNNARRWSLVF